MNVTLQIRHSDEPLRPAAAWFIAGWHAAGWLEEMAQWGIPLGGLRLFVVPHGPADLRPCGVLVVPANATPPRTTCRAHPYARVADRLYLPVEGRIEPPASDVELAALLDAEQTYVWHPAAGLVVFDAIHALRVNDLLIPPQQCDADWSAAQPGVALQSRLLAIEPEQRLDLAAMLREGGGDIGSRPPKLDELPPSPAEPSGNPAARMGDALRRGIARAVRRLTSQVPHTGSQRTWINDVEDWAGRQLDRAASSLMAQRYRELTRLLELLANDPDRGLRYALPMGGDAHRGLAPPGGSLPPRDVDFNLRRLGGGGPADIWDVPPDYQRRLTDRYRELANREIALGRHRRAAYILAELLGDVQGAAATLTDGGHFREAAALYEERLKRPLLAAQCLERGGLWTEAIDLYERLAEHERVGDLCRQLDQPERAALAYRRAVEVRLKSRDFLAAAALLESKLAAPREALEILFDGWRDSPQRPRCLAEAFRMLARMPDHERALRQVGLLRAPMAAADHLLLAQGFAQVAATYPDASVCQTAADATRLLAAERLEQRPPMVETQALTTVVSQLAPEDRLLARDCRRFAAERQNPPAARPSRKPRTPCPLVREIQLPPANWRTAVSLGDCFFAAGYRGEREWIVVAGNWAGELLATAGRRNRHASPSSFPPILLTSHESGQPTVVICPLGEPVEHERTLPEVPWLPRGVRIGSHTAVSSQVVALQYSNQGVLHLIEEGPGVNLVLKSFGLTGSLLGSQTLTTLAEVLNERSLQFPLPFFVRGPECYFARRERVFVVADGKSLPLFDTGFLRVQSLTGSPPHTRTRIIAGCERGGVIAWGNRASDGFKLFAADLHSPAVGLSRGGWLIAATREETQLYDTHNSRTFTARTTFATAGAANKADPLAVLATRAHDEFALLLGDDRLLIYQTPDRALAPRYIERF